VGLGVDLPRDCDDYGVNLCGEPPLPFFFGTKRGRCSGASLPGMLSPRRVARWSRTSPQAAGKDGGGERGRTRCSRRIAHHQGYGKSAQGKPQQEKGTRRREGNCNEQMLRITSPSDA
jgi:hypothetical protein